MLVRIYLALVVAMVALPASAGSVVEFNIHQLGSFTVELYDQDKPVTTSNFLRYVTSGSWTNMFVHRCNPNFVIQGGGFKVTNRFEASAGMSRVTSFGAITNEYGVGAQLSNVYGTIAMARIGGQTNSATTDWFINLKDNLNLDFVDGGFTVFGRMISGTNVLNLFRTFSGANLVSNVIDYNIKIPVDGVLTTFGELPGLSTNRTYSNNLVYADIRLKQLDMRLQTRALSDGTREVSWNSFSNQPNILEYVTNVMETNWQELITTNGNGQRIQVIDAITGSSNRFYRLRFSY